ncbi:MAG: hypothetical protein WDA75_20190, partial [Candidatus Latescibacterota bacterium]
MPAPLRAAHQVTVNPVADSWQDTVVLSVVNPGPDPRLLTALTVLPETGSAIPSDGVLPLLLAPGDSVRIGLRFTLAGAGDPDPFPDSTDTTPGDSVAVPPDTTAVAPEDSTTAPPDTTTTPPSSPADTTVTTPADTTTVAPGDSAGTPPDSTATPVDSTAASPD